MDYMAQALSLARLALGQASPNPAVGAVIVKNDIIIGQGYTQPPGSDHAEIVALKQAGQSARGAALYITLEPCCHFGRTPPCTQAIIDAGITDVHFAMEDPNPLISGRGNETLRRAGINTYIGEHAAEAAELNEAFIKYITTGLPFITVKFACSLDGRIATRTGNSQWISCEESRKQVQRMRCVSDAVMTGANTVIADNPQLTVRLDGQDSVTRQQPLRIIVDGRGRISPESRIFSEPGKTIVVVDSTLDPEIKRPLEQAGAELLELPSSDGIMDLKQLLKTLGEKEITSILVEGGGILIGSLFDQCLVDKVVVFLAPIVIGGTEARPAVAGKGVARLSDCPKLKRVRVERIGVDIMVCGYITE